MYKLTVGPPPSVPSLTRQGKPSCHCLEKIKKYSFNPLFNIGRHWINLILGYLDLRYYPCPFILFRLYIQFTSWWVRFKFILSFKTSILLNTLNMFGAHYVGESLKNLRKFLVRVPIGMVIPPLYEGDHRDDHLSCLPIIKPFPLGNVSNAHVWGNVVFGPKILHTLLGVN